MSHLRRAGITVVVALFSAGLVTVSASTANAAEEGASAAKAPAKVMTTNARRDTGWY